TRQANERQASLKGWQELAAKKMKNQDRYLQAINISINAVDRRLKQLIDDSSGSKKKSKKLEEKRDLNPYQRYEARLDELERQRERQLANQRQAELNQKLVSGEIKSSLALRDAQRIDLRLASREAKLSEEERRRIAATPLEEKGWLEIWQRAATNAIGKKKRLSDELDKTLAALKALEVDKQYVDYQKELHGKEIARIDKEIVATRGTRTRALRDTVTNWFRQNAWDLPIGFLLAWILWQLAKTATNTLVTRAKSREKVSRATVQQVETLASIAQGLLKLAIILLTLFWFLKRLGVNVTPLLGGAAIFGLAISFGSQNLVRDVVTGFFILLEKQYAVGDVIQVGDIWGEVEQLTLRRTLIRGRDGKAHIIPNGAITQVSNLTLGWSVATVHVGVSYSAKLGHVREVVDRVGDEMYADEAWKDKFLEGPPRYVGLTEMADSALVIRVKAKTKPYQNWPIQLELNHRLKEAFDDAGIEIPFPQRDVHLIQPK
ncbi:MAG: mechanosensitive ion channel, partial [Myxococcales bacterium]|nr:mechanosensitive ion channel [Myxococcales bacterium]